MANKDYIGALVKTIRHLHKAQATHVQSIRVTERHYGKTVWDGVVEVFDLTGHPKAKRVYAWGHETSDSDNLRHVTVLHVPPVVSPETAVRAAIIREFRENAQA